MEYKSKRNSLRITCVDCYTDITLGKVYIDKGKPLCEDCNYERGNTEQEYDNE